MKIIRRLLIFVILAIAVLSIVSFWLTSEASEKYPIHYNELIEKYAKENKVDPFLALFSNPEHRSDKSLSIPFRGTCRRGGSISWPFQGKARRLLLHALP